MNCYGNENRGGCPPIGFCQSARWQESDFNGYILNLATKRH